MNYEDKTNRWIAIEVAKRLGKRVSTVTEFHEGDGCVVYPHDNQINFDPCNNPSDAWPIIVDNKIGITHGSQMCSAVAVTDNELIQIPCNPSELLRAAMICFLKMKDAEK